MKPTKKPAKRKAVIAAPILRHWPLPVIASAARQPQPITNRHCERSAAISTPTNPSSRPKATTSTHYNPPGEQNE